MAKRKLATRPQRTTATPGQASARDSAGPSSWFTGRAIRETVESVVVAFILAFMFRAFEAEAFVIPTGSMAPTLLGANKDLWCPECGYHYQAGASSEEDQMAQQRGRPASGQPVVHVTCPMCRFTANVGPGHDQPTYGGDRILVSKLAYEFGQPQRWDVIVFRYPAEAETNFIKRMVGLPNETIRLWHGDLYVKPPGGTQFAIERREPAKLRAMAQIVYDNDYVVDSMTAAGWPLRWQSWPSANANTKGWASADGGRSFSIEPPADDTVHWLRYRHFVPSIDDWRRIKRKEVAHDQVKPLLITDFYAYDTSIERNQFADNPRVLGHHWVGDLLLECDLESSDGKGAAVLDLVKGGKHFRCELDCETGEATLTIDGVPDFRRKAQTAWRGGGEHRIAFANIDRQLTLWVDGRVAEFDGPTSYEPLDNDIPRSTPEDPLDLAPAGIGAKSVGLSVSRIRLRRDIYYIAASHSGPAGLTDYAHGQIGSLSYQQLFQFLSSPEYWAPPGQASPFDQRTEAVFPLGDDQFFMLGDNSPMSEDARLWNDEKFVSRELLIGRALVIFWPHSFNQIPGTRIPFPFFPNFAGMGLIR
jgi:signal peptidase I